jgi:hypothetical protein
MKPFCVCPVWHKTAPEADGEALLNGALFYDLSLPTVLYNYILYIHKKFVLLKLWTDK